MLQRFADLGDKGGMRLYGGARARWLLATVPWDLKTTAAFELTASV